MEFSEKIKTLLDLGGFRAAEVSIENEHHKVTIMADDEIIRSNLAVVLPAAEHLINLIAHREGLPAHIVDINYYRRERERLIVELAKAAAKKAVITKSEVSLPAMNAYERRLVHVEISTHPDLKTESVGLGKDRHIVIQLIS